MKKLLAQMWPFDPKRSIWEPSKSSDNGQEEHSVNVRFICSCGVGRSVCGHRERDMGKYSLDVRRCAYVLYLSVITVVIFVLYSINRGGHIQINSDYLLKHSERYPNNLRPPDDLSSMEARRRHMENTCSNRSEWTSYLRNVFGGLNHAPMFYSNFTDLAFCKIGKSGSTEMSRIFIMMDKPRYKSVIWRVGGNTIHGLARKWVRKTYGDEKVKKILVTRNPFSRLFSGYLDKVYLLKLYYVIMGVGKYTRHIDPHIAGQCLTNVTFQEFLDYIILKTKNKSPIDPHFAPIFSACKVCGISYKYVVKLESFRQDLEYVLEREVNDSSLLFNIFQHLDNMLIEARIKSAILTTNHKKFRENNCTTQTEVAERIWDALKMQGYLSTSMPFQPDLFNATKNPKQLATAFNRLVKKHGVDKEEKKKSRARALVNAYKGINPKTIAEIQHLYYMDFKAFGYSMDPPQ